MKFILPTFFLFLFSTQVNAQLFVTPARIGSYQEFFLVSLGRASPISSKEFKIVGGEIYFDVARTFLTNRAVTKPNGFDEEIKNITDKRNSGSTEGVEISPGLARYLRDITVAVGEEVFGTGSLEELTRVADSAPPKKPLTVDEQAREIRGKRLQVIQSVIRQTMVTSGQAQSDMQDSLANRKELFNQTNPVRKSVVPARTALASIFKNDSSRHTFISLANQKLKLLSNEVKEQIKSAKENIIFVDELVVGMGPEGSAYVQEKTSSDPNRTVLVVDMKSKPGGTFADVAASFRLNSTNRQNTGNRASPGQGDLNYVHDIVGLPDFNRNRWVEAGKLGEVATTGVIMSSALPMLETQVVSVEKSSTPDARFLVTLKDVKTNDRYLVKTNKTVFISGLGTQAIKFADTATNSLVTKIREEAARALEVPAIESFTEYVERFGDYENKNPLKDVIGKEILLIGGGDSGKVVAELLSGLGPETGYKQSVAQTGSVKRIVWFVGEGSFENCKQYIDKARARYSSISQAINSGLLVVVPGKANGLALEGKQIRVSKFNVEFSRAYRFSFSSAAQTITEVTSGGRIPYIKAADPRQGIAEVPTSEGILFDKVLVATGFQNKLLNVISSLIDLPLAGNINLGDYFERIDTVVKGFGDKAISVARSLRGEPNVQLLGPANESLGGLPQATELKGINENTVSLFANIERTKAMAVLNAKEALTDISTAASELFNRVLEKLTKKEEVEARISKLDMSIKPNLSDKLIRPVQDANLAVRTALDDLISKYRIKNSDAAKGDTLKLRFEKLSGEASSSAGTQKLKSIAEGYSLSIEGIAFTEQQIEDLQKRISENGLLNKTLERYYLGDKSQFKALEVAVPFAPKASGFDFTRLSVTPIK